MGGGVGRAAKLQGRKYRAIRTKVAFSWMYPIFSFYSLPFVSSEVGVDKTAPSFPSQV